MLTRISGFRRERRKNLDVFRKKKPQHDNNGDKNFATRGFD